MRKVIPANSAFQKYSNCAEARDKLGNLSKSREIKYLWVLTQYQGCLKQVVEKLESVLLLHFCVGQLYGHSLCLRPQFFFFNLALAIGRFTCEPYLQFTGVKIRKIREIALLVQQSC